MTIDLSDLVKAFGDDAAKREADYERMRKNFIEEKCNREKLSRQLEEANKKIADLEARLAQTRTVGNYEAALKAMPEGDLARDPRESLAWWQKQLRDAKTEDERFGISWQIKQAEERLYKYNQNRGNQNGLL